MKEYEWNNEKNEKLKKERGISFEEIVIAIENGNAIDVVYLIRIRKNIRIRMFILLILMNISF